MCIEFQHFSCQVRNYLCHLVMAALCSRCGHYIFVLWFLLSSSFFPRLRISRRGLCRVPDCPEVEISEFKLVNRSRELVNSQFELGPDRSSPIWVTTVT